MKRSVLILFLMLFGLLLASCAGGEGENTAADHGQENVPPVSGDASSPDTTVKGDEELDAPTVPGPWDKGYDEAEYHKSIGMKIYGKNSLALYYDYDRNTYDGYLQYAVDCMYRAKLQYIENHRKKANRGEMTEIYDAICSYLSEHQPMNLVPDSDLSGRDIMYDDWFWAIVELAKYDEKRLSEDKELVRMLSLYIKYINTYRHYDIIKYDNNKIQNYKLLTEAIMGKPIEVLSQHYDSEIGRTVIDIDRQSDQTVYVFLNYNGQRRASWDLAFLPNEPVALPANYEGKVLFAAAKGKMHPYYEAEYDVVSNFDKIADKEVQLKSKRLDKAVRAYIGVGDDEKLYVKDLVSIECISWYDDLIDIRPSEALPAWSNKDTMGEKDDFFFSDFEYFINLRDLTVRNNYTGDLTEESLKYFMSVRIFNCDIKDISGLKNSQLFYLTLNNTEVRDYSVAETMISMRNLGISHATIDSIKLAYINYDSVFVTHTNVDSIDFLNGADSVKYFYGTDTNITTLEGLSWSVLKNGGIYRLPKGAEVKYYNDMHPGFAAKRYENEE